jgi:toxin FitB
MFEQRVLPVTEEIIFKWRLLVEDGRKAGYTFSQPDLIIAARRSIMAALAVTRNLSDYERVRTRVFNPWVDSLPASASSGCGGSLDSSHLHASKGETEG